MRAGSGVWPGPPWAADGRFQAASQACAASPPGMLAAPGSAARRGQMARDLRVHAHVIERAGRYGGDNRPAMGATRGRRAVITTLPRGDRADDQPYQQNYPTDSHIDLPKTGGSADTGEPRANVVLSSTPRTADTRANRVRYGA